MTEREACWVVCDSVREAQLKRFVKAGYTYKEAKNLWLSYQSIYLKNWREYVAEGLISLPEGLKKISSREINNYMGVNR